MQSADLLICSSHHVEGNKVGDGDEVKVLVRYVPRRMKCRPTVINSRTFQCSKKTDIERVHRGYTASPNCCTARLPELGVI